MRQNDSRPCRRHMALTPSHRRLLTGTPCRARVRLPGRARGRPLLSAGLSRVKRVRPGNPRYFAVATEAWASWLWRSCCSRSGLCSVVLARNRRCGEPYQRRPPTTIRPAGWRAAREGSTGALAYYRREGVGPTHCLLPRRSSHDLDASDSEVGSCSRGRGSQPSTPAAYVRQHEGRSRDQIRERRAFRQTQERRPSTGEPAPLLLKPLTKGRTHS